ncbi:ABC transporter permease [Methylocystis sp. MJC1]|jgi:microcin C transport system permease protein|uniref:ABC transporter permease n=1 Tax=Methylocystis sp. MJC1 TaxID=2654282 RepID=UPI0013EC7836|nr:ABC transporter permease [Methylocystis sp. MJC1]KAF2992265.1 Inner membrane ABC transporter permease protein YejE [Methylocystis sp. MJC1]MBU6527405.1 ABC transporter permease [Methylocystis sp. MJC1]UZX10355.1 ABC transporter permease [Methylocystis sp. MJC1]
MSVIDSDIKLAPPIAREGLLRLSPLDQRRLASFKANKRGYWSFWIFMTLFVMSLLSNILANDRPIVAWYKGELLFPAFVAYPEEKFGGFLARTDYRDPVIANEIEAHGWMLWPPVHYSYDTHNLELPVPAPSPPTWMLTPKQCEAAAAKGLHPGEANRGCAALEYNWLGTDDQGRDVVARLLYGFRISVLFGLILATISSIVGVAAGAIQGYFGGRVDLVFQRFIEVWSSLPQLYLLIIISSFLTPGFFVLLGILLLFSWVSLVHVVRAEFLRARNFEYVNAARALGLSNFHIIVKHLLPNATVATLTFLPFILNSSITTLTALDFLGFGLPPGSPSLGELLLQGKSNLQAPWLGLTGFAIIALMLSLLVFIGEAVRDAFDPRKNFQ